MKKLISIILIAVLFLLPGCSNEDARYKWYLREDIKFGMSEAEISELLGDEEFERRENDTSVFLGINHCEDLHKCNVDEVYQFEDDSLTNVLFNFTQDETISEASDFSGMFTELEGKLNEKYGEPIISRHKDDDYGVYSYWQLSDMDITLSNNKESVLLGYGPSKAEAPKKELTEKEKMLSKISELVDKDLAFDAGSYIMGDIPKGEYAFVGFNTSKYYCEEDAAGNIIDNENFQSFGYVYVHGLGNIETRGVLVSVNAFAELGVTGAKQLYEIINEQPNYTQSGMYKIGVDIPAGIYTVESIGSGYFALLTGPVGNNDIIDNDNFTGRKQISTSNGQYLELSRVQISE